MAKKSKSSRTKASHSNRKPSGRVCIFHARGYCRNGPKCPYSHGRSAEAARTPPAPPAVTAGRETKAVPMPLVRSAEDVPALPASPAPPVGSAETDSAPTPQASLTEAKTASAPLTDSARRTALRSARRKRKRGTDEEGVERKCGVCLESVAKKGERYGLLSKCDHVYCSPCMKTWRKPKGGLANGAEKTCPICRVKSDFVLSSFNFVVGDEKEVLIEKYRDRCAGIDCTYHGKNGKCFFGTECFYRHANADGTIVDKEKMREEIGEATGMKGVRRIAEMRQVNRKVGKASGSRAEDQRPVKRARRCA